MKKMLTLAIATFILATPIVFAAENSATNSSEATQPALHNNMQLSADSPPGLESKGGAEFPQGLEKSEKMPHGWSKGEKRGWDRDRFHHRHHHHSHHFHHHHHDHDEHFEQHEH